MPKKTISNAYYLDLISKGWEDYHLLDSGGERKLEQFGSIRLVRFEPEAVWKPALPIQSWEQSHANYSIKTKTSTGSWNFREGTLQNWLILYQNIAFTLSVTESRHIGIFPEQQPNWDWVAEKISSSREQLKILNLFAYTGGMTIFSSKSGAEVTHVDASRSAVQIAKINLQQSGLGDNPVRFIVDDAVQFVQKEIRRGNKYDGIFLDPPAFGRGPKKQTWKFERSLTELLSDCSQILVPDPALFLLTAYNIKQSVVDLKNRVEDILINHSGQIHYGKLIQQEKSAGRLINQAVYVRWSKK